MNQNVSNFAGPIGWAWLITVVVWIVGSFSNKQAVRRQPSASRVVHICFGLFAGLLIWGQGPWKMLAGPIVLPHSAATGRSALLLTIIGLGFALWSRFTIGRNWSAVVTIKQDHELIRRGPYAIVRHPIYCGFLVALVGTGIERGTIGAFAGVAILATIVQFKSRLEERFMTEQFGDAYRKYRTEVRGIIPFIW